LWGALNFVVAYVLLSKSRRITSPWSLDALLIGLAFLGTAMALAAYFG
jgi:hypothetical protein